jgi:hypothetical protein
MDYESKDKGQKGGVRYIHTENALNTDGTHKIRSRRPNSRVAVKKDVRRAEQKKTRGEAAEDIADSGDNDTRTEEFE